MLNVDGIRKRFARFTSWSRTVRQARSLTSYKVTCRDLVREWRGTIELAQLYHLAAIYGFSETDVEDELYRADDEFNDKQLTDILSRHCGSLDRWS